MKGLKLLFVAVPLLLAAALILYVTPGYSFLPQVTVVSGSAIGIHWSSGSMPINWEINNTIGSANIAGTSTDVLNATIASFTTWTSVPNTTLLVNAPLVNTSITDVSQIPAGTNFVCVSCTGGTFSGDGTLAVTSTSFNTTTGQILQSFIIFNPSAQTSATPPKPICFTVGGNVSCPTAGSVLQDFQTVMTHEIGHFFGLDHSAVVRAEMFPYAQHNQPDLSYDDAAAISFLYPSSSPTVPTGSISGTVTLSGSGVFGAHVFADPTTTATNPFYTSANIRKSAIGTLTQPNGNYTITGLPFDTYLVVAEPLDGPETDGNVYWAVEWGQSAVQTNFTTRWH